VEIRVLDLLLRSYILRVSEVLCGDDKSVSRFFNVAGLIMSTF
jgi:hypothetical protein